MECIMKGKRSHNNQTNKQTGNERGKKRRGPVNTKKHVVRLLLPRKKESRWIGGCTCTPRQTGMWGYMNMNMAGRGVNVPFLIGVTKKDPVAVMAPLTLAVLSCLFFFFSFVFFVVFYCC